MDASLLNPFGNAERHGTDSMKWLKYPPEILPLWVADMDFPAPPQVVDAVRERVDHGVFGYSLPTAELVETCLAYFARQWAWQVKPEWLVFSPGLGVSIHTVSRYLGNPELGMLVPVPIYHVFRTAPARAQRQQIDVPMVRDGDGWALDPEQVATAAKQAGGAGILMLCNPHNPNGKVFTRNELETLAELALRHDWLICADEVHADLILDADATHVPIASLHPSIAARCVTMQSPSKTFNVAGLNFAVVVIPDRAVRERYMYGAEGQVNSLLNPFGMAATQAAWGGSCAKWLDACITFLRGNRDLLRQAIADIDGITMLPLPATYLAWLDVSALGLANPAAHFEAHGLGMSSGEIFGCPGYMRLNFGCDRATVELAIARLREAGAGA